jgi:hypothetical protein
MLSFSADSNPDAKFFFHILALGIRGGFGRGRPPVVIGRQVVNQVSQGDANRQKTEGQ